MIIKLTKFNRVNSTNDQAIKMIKLKKIFQGIVVANLQTKGKGTMGKKWISQKGNFFGSVFFNKPEWITKLKEGFETLNQLPDWYIYALLAAIASSFGMKVTDLAIKKFKK